ncbi:MAG TPA: peptidoglycan-binding domain-containing protein [Paracoccaceae bacterium]|nr:peptidoglycan-binding domain-containing protein [Paracoccaceae bacterium]
MRLFFVVAALGLAPLAAQAEEPLADLIAEATEQYLALPDSPELAEVLAVRGFLDRIVAEYPASEAAVRIILKDPIGDLDVARLDELAVQAATNFKNAPSETAEPPDEFAANACWKGLNLKTEFSIEIDGQFDANGALTGLPQLASAETADILTRSLYAMSVMALDACGAYPELASQTVTFKVRPIEGLEVKKDLWQTATAQTQAALDLTRQENAELQARLKASGFDPNGIDGVFGKGTRTALGRWQEGVGIPRSGYLDAPQYAFFVAETEAAFNTWMQTPANAALVRRAGVAPSKVPSNRVGQYWRGTDGCLRTRNDNRRGSIVIGKSNFCNLRALGLK